MLSRHRRFQNSNWKGKYVLCARWTQRKTHERESENGASKMRGYECRYTASNNLKTCTWGADRGLSDRFHVEFLFLHHHADGRLRATF